MGARTLGIDVSHYQGEVSWSSVATSEVAFCFIKATEAGGWVDPWFERNWRRAQEAGLFRGAYHFGRVGSDPKANAHHFFSVVGALGFRDLPPVLDIEDGDGHTAEHIKAWTREFLKEAKRLFDRVPIIYTGSFWRGEMKNPADPDFGEHPLCCPCPTGPPDRPVRPGRRRLQQTNREGACATEGTLSSSAAWRQSRQLTVEAAAASKELLAYCR